MSIQCTEVQAELPLFVGGDLESPGRERVAEHLESCDSCRDSLARASEARAVLTEQLEQTAQRQYHSEQGTSVWPNLRERLCTEGLIVGAAPMPEPVVAQRGRLLRFASYTAAAASLLFLGSLAGQWFAQSTGDGSVTPGVRSISDPGGTPLVEVERPASPERANPRSGGLREINAGESFAANSRLFQSEVIQPFNAFASDGMRAASYPSAGQVNQVAGDRGVR